ncbi:nucleoid-associated protein NdpA [Elysia marginata]|uniref:Nucleoid-associated protein NdpA n=1 Tax=Elysia marginata TaxID=1093978 RepID=A0AAV4I0U2_9GAST|nr:nucleoid-associated protein NdpA [Elysia marginata]
MLEFYSAQITNLALHKIGNKSKDEHLILSDSELITIDEEGLILKEFFLKPFREREENYFHFDSDKTQAGVLDFADDIFDQKDFIKSSQDIAKHLYDCSRHPHIKPGELFVAHFTNIIIEGEEVDAVGIFKSEIKQHFFKFKNSAQDLLLSIEEGVNANKLDKGCLIFNTNREEGYKLLSLDTNRYDTKYWTEQFLKILPLADNHYFTKSYLKFCHKFAKDVILPAEDKQQEVMFMNKAVNHFAKNDSFEEDAFLRETIDNPQLLPEFHNYKGNEGLKYGIEDVSSFPIVDSAVREARKGIKDIIELDTHFQLKINFTNATVMDRYLEKGWDEEKQMYYYLIYFNEELKK